jgi:hypothetical protein
VLNNLFAHVSLNISIKEQFLAVVPHLFFALLFVLCIIYFFPNEYSYFWAVVKAIVFSLLYLSFLKVIRAPILTEGDILIKQLKNRFQLDKKN